MFNKFLETHLVRVHSRETGDCLQSTINFLLSCCCCNHACPYLINWFVVAIMSEMRANKIKCLGIFKATFKSHLLFSTKSLVKCKVSLHFFIFNSLQKGRRIHDNETCIFIDLRKEFGRAESWESRWKKITSEKVCRLQSPVEEGLWARKLIFRRKIKVVLWRRNFLPFWISVAKHNKAISSFPHSTFLAL